MSLDAVGNWVENAMAAFRGHICMCAGTVVTRTSLASCLGLTERPSPYRALTYITACTVGSIPSFAQPLGVALPVCRNVGSGADRIYADFCVHMLTCTLENRSR